MAPASVGYGASLLLPERLTPEELSGHALGLHFSGMLTMQGVGAAVAGTVAQLTSPATAMAALAAASAAVTPALAGRSRRSRAERSGGEVEGVDRDRRADGQERPFVPVVQVGRDEPTG
ncbi:hypothetical protein [Nonomuraea sp. NPDC050643]|uniref:hypothetical protein n=1 Tax=Nonomuraea sp. NPDC050643 TaxID=3155660 RepID=UPI0033E5CAE7